MIQPLNHTIEQLLKALANLGYVGNYVLNGNPQTETEFNSKFQLVTGKEENGSAITTRNPADFGFTWSELATEIANVKQEQLDTEYQRQRAAEYPDVKLYLDGIVKGDQEQIQSYIDACLAVKAKYPKPD